MKLHTWPAIVLAFFLALISLPSKALAQTGATPPSPAHSLACLQRPSEALRYPERARYDRASGFMRVRLQFVHPDAAPKVEVLANTARQDMQDLVFDFLRSYRLPCLTAADGQVAVVQEFHFSNSVLDSTPIADPAGHSGESCVVMPRTDPMPSFLSSNEIEHVVVAFVFQGDATAAPEVRIIHSTGDKGFEQLTVSRVNEYRMPCRKPGAPMQAYQQRFTFVPDRAARYAFKRESFGLAEFLAMVKGAKTLKANFDFSTMSCPFDLRIELLAPTLPNEVSSVGPHDSNRVPFMHWMSQLQLDFKSEAQARALFGERLLVRVPCGTLRLGEDAQ